MRLLCIVHTSPAAPIGLTFSFPALAVVSSTGSTAPASDPSIGTRNTTFNFVEVRTPQGARFAYHSLSATAKFADRSHEELRLEVCVVRAVWVSGQWSVGESSCSAAGICDALIKREAGGGWIPRTTCSPWLLDAGLHRPTFGSTQHEYHLVGRT